VPRPLKAGPELDIALAEVRAARALDPANDNAERWRRGDLRWKLLPHQLLSYDAIKAWDAYRQTEAYSDMVESVGANFDDLYVDLSGRRVGKTSEKIIMLDEIAIKRPGAVLTYFTALQKDIGGIIVPLARELIMGLDCPPECKPEFMRSHMEHGMGLFYPNGSYIKLVGVDKNPDGLRGRWSDGIIGSETSFIATNAIDGQGLEYLVMSVLLPQFVHRPWAFLVLESSAPKDPEHSMLTVFVPDARLRGACLERTLDDNTSLSEREYKKIIRQAGGRGNPNCEREYFNVVSRDPSSYVVPEWSDEKNIRELARPEQALCYTIADPGSSDLFGLTFGFVHFEQAKLVIERGWARKNASTRTVAAVIAFFEWKLWGRQPGPLLADIPYQRARDRDGWRELLVGTGASEDDCRALRELANLTDEERAPLQWPLRPPDDHSTYWHRTEQLTKQNPFARYSDVDLRFVRDLSTDFGLEFSATAKDDADAQRNAFRNAVEAGRFVVSPQAPDVAAHIKNAVWPETGTRHGTEWARHATYGHFDLLACGIYGWRNADFTMNPTIPAHRLADRATMYVNPKWEREQEEDMDEMSGVLFGGDRGARTTRGGRPSRR
jgi:hypothetical protein